MALGNIKTDIIDFYNEACIGKLTSSAATTDLDIAIQTTLDDLSAMLDSLKATDTDQTLSADDKYLEYPTDFKTVVSIVLINSSSVRQSPLEMLPRGHVEYRELLDNDNANGDSIWYSEFDGKFWLWRPANGSYTTEIEYYRYHPRDTLTNILFDNFMKNAVMFGTVFHKALLRGNPKYISIWKPMYEVEKEKCRLLLPEEPYVSKG